MSTSTEHPPTSPTAGTDDADAESNKRSERKRRREKQRRSDLSNAFDELAAFIVQVEPGAGEDDTDKKGKKRKSSDGGEDSAGITRLDLIGRALRIMKRLYRENEERKRVIATIEGRGGGANDNVSDFYGMHVSNRGKTLRWVGWDSIETICTLEVPCNLYSHLSLFGMVCFLEGYCHGSDPGAFRG
jgi:hypothetical protein